MKPCESGITTCEELKEAFEAKNVDWYRFLIEGCMSAVDALTSELKSVEHVRGVKADSIREGHPREIARNKRRIERYKRDIAAIAE